MAHVAGTVRMDHIQFDGPPANPRTVKMWYRPNLVCGKLPVHRILKRKPMCVTVMVPDNATCQRLMPHRGKEVEITGPVITR